MDGSFCAGVTPREVSGAGVVSPLRLVEEL
jgi:hypothetical protein